MAMLAPRTIDAVFRLGEIVEYRIVDRDTTSDLEIIVNQMIGYGWQPYGTPITVHGYWFQPMVKFAGTGAE